MPKVNPNVSLNGIRFDSTIPNGAKILFAEFCEWSKDEDSFPYEAKTLSKMYSVSPFTIRKWIRVLAEHKLITMHIDISKGSQQKLITVTSGK